MNEKASSFMMNETTISQIKVLPEEHQLKFFWAVSNFGLYGTEPKFDGLEQAVWIPMREQLIVKTPAKESTKRESTKRAKEQAES
jgi:hypothetical protein